jgi:hypothetical protein
MFMRSITCKGCHVLHAETTIGDGGTSRASEKSCENCHGKGFNRLLDQWKKATQQKLDLVNQQYRQTSSVLSGTQAHKNYAEAMPLLKEAKYNIDLVEHGKSVHNIQFSDELLRTAHRNMTKILGLLASPVKLTQYPETSNLVPGECNSCHFGIEETKQSIRGLQFSHRSHILDRKQTCQNCHSNERKHGEFIMKRSQCASCHHEETVKKQCTACHKLQSTIYSGQLQAPLFTMRPDTMFLAEVACEACHNRELNQTIVANVKSCLECHDADPYEKMYDEWRNTTLQQMDSIRIWFGMNERRHFTAEQQVQLNRVKDVVEFVKNDGSEGAHNPYYIHGILIKANEILKEIGK